MSELKELGASHTPGPWLLRWGRRDNYATIEGPKGELVVVIPDYDDRQKPNAHLIAAAPEMLEALKAVRPYFEGEHSYDHPHCVLIRAIIAKAEGAS